MKVYSGKSALMQDRTVRAAGYFLLIVALIISVPIVPPVGASSPQQDAKEAKEAGEKLDREARKALRAGKYEVGLKIYLGMIETDGRDNRARLGASFAYLKMQNYPPSFQQSKEVLSVDANNARAHALAGVSLLRSGFIRAAVGELQQSLDLDQEAWLTAARPKLTLRGPSKDARSSPICLQPDPESLTIWHLRAFLRRGLRILRKRQMPANLS
jgi:tetratricopeptide (TPR) repeat protein